MQNGVRESTLMREREAGSITPEGGQHSTVGDQPTQDEAAIRQIVQQVQDGWNSGDGDAFAAPFAEDADYVVVHGQHVKGRAAIASGHQHIFDTIYRGSSNTFTVEDVRFIRPDVALAHVHHHLKLQEPVTWPTGEVVRGAQARSTWVLTKNDGEWSIAAFHNAPIAGTRE